MAPAEEEEDLDQEAMAAEWEAAMGGDDEGDGGEGDDLAAEWDAMTSGDEEAGETPGETTRVLNQDEIDSLLGFDDV